MDNLERDYYIKTLSSLFKNKENLGDGETFQGEKEFVLGTILDGACDGNLDCSFYLDRIKSRTVFEKILNDFAESHNEGRFKFIMEELGKRGYERILYSGRENSTSFNKEHPFSTGKGISENTGFYLTDDFRVASGYANGDYSFVPHLTDYEYVEFLKDHGELGGFTLMNEGVNPYTDEELYTLLDEENFPLVVAASFEEAREEVLSGRMTNTGIMVCAVSDAPGKILEVDFEGRHWKYGKDGLTTDDFVRDAKSQGYSRVEFKNVIDEGKYGHHLNPENVTVVLGEGEILNLSSLIRESDRNKIIAKIEEAIYLREKPESIENVLGNLNKVSQKNKPTK